MNMVETVPGKFVKGVVVMAIRWMAIHVSARVSGCFLLGNTERSFSVSQERSVKYFNVRSDL